MSRVWTAASLGFVGLLIGSAAGALGALVMASVLAAVGWLIAQISNRRQGISRQCG